MSILVFFALLCLSGYILYISFNLARPAGAEVDGVGAFIEAVFNLDTSSGSSEWFVLSAGGVALFFIGTLVLYAYLANKALKNLKNYDFKNTDTRSKTPYDYFLQSPLFRVQNGGRYKTQDVYSFLKANAHFLPSASNLPRFLSLGQPVLIAIGIFGTFYGLTEGLNEFLPLFFVEDDKEGLDMKVMTEAMQKLLLGAKVAFSSSLVGVGLGTVYLVQLKQVHSFLSQTLLECCKELDAQFDSQPEGDLDVLVGQMSAINTSMGKIHNVIPQIVGILRQQHQQLIQQIDHTEKAFESSMVRNRTDIVRELRPAQETLSSIAKSLGTTRLSNMKPGTETNLMELVKGINYRLGRVFADKQNRSIDVIDLLNSLKTNTQVLNQLGNVPEQLNSLSSIANDLESLSTNMGDMKGPITALPQNLGDVATQLKGQAGSLRAMHDVMKANTEQLNKHTEALNTSNECIESNTNAITPISEPLKMLASDQGPLHVLSSSLGSHKVELEKTTTKYQDFFNTITKNSEQIKDSTENLNTVLDGVQKQLPKLNTSLKDLEESVSEVGGFWNTHKDALESIEERTKEAFGEQQQHLDRIQTTAKDVFDKQDESLTKLNTLVEKAGQSAGETIEKANVSLQNALNSTSTAVQEQLKNVGTQVEDTLSKAETSMVAGLEKQQETVTQAIKDSGRELDTLLKEAGDTLKTNLEEVQGTVEQALETAGKKMVEGLEVQQEASKGVLDTTIKQLEIVGQQTSNEIKSAGEVAGEALEGVKQGVKETLELQNTKLNEVLTGLNEAYENETKQRQAFLIGLKDNMEDFVTKTKAQIENLREVVELGRILDVEVWRQQMDRLEGSNDLIRDQITVVKKQSDVVSNLQKTVQSFDATHKQSLQELESAQKKHIGQYKKQVDEQYAWYGEQVKKWLKEYDERLKEHSLTTQKKWIERFTEEDTKLRDLLTDLNTFVTGFAGEFKQEQNHMSEIGGSLVQILEALQQFDAQVRKDLK